MENNQFTPPQGGMQQQPVYYKPPVPNATGALVCGICAIVFAWCYAIPGIVLGVIAISLSKKANDLFAANPGMYSEPSLGNAKAGKILGIIGLCLAVLFLIWIIFWIALFGTILSNMPWHDMRPR